MNVYKTRIDGENICVMVKIVLRILDGDNDNQKMSMIHRRCFLKQ